MQRLQASQQMKQANTQGADIRYKQAAVLIDGENIAASYVQSLHNFLLADLPQQQALVQELDLFGKDDVLRHWQAISLAYPFHSHTHNGGKNAADHAMQQEALALADHGVRLFYLVSNDGGFAQIVRNLRTRGCHVICLGNALSRKLKAACNDFFILIKSTDSINVIRSSDASTHSSQGEQPMNHTFVLRDDSQTAIQLLYQSPFLPAYFPRLLHLFVEQTFRALCLTEQESEMTHPVPLPADYAEMLEALAADPLFQRFLGDGGTLQQRQAVLAFAQRCDYIYERAHNEAKSAFQAYPQTALTDLVKEDVKERLTHWHHPNPFDVPEKYRHAYQVIPISTEAAEQVVMQRWYHRGFERGVRDAAAIQHQAWMQAKDAPQEEGKQYETNRYA
ncbi:MAG: NYN domain-containing protein [Ktedonobacteraceae bacterium]|nr:NYN domain-containing protein [Ktedonobacteraceae bacterium]